MELINNLFHVDTDQGIRLIEINSDDFSIDEMNIESELCKAGVLLCYYSDLAAELDAKAANLKNKADEVRGKQAIELRKVHTGSRLTENMLDEMIVTSPGYQTIRSLLVEAQKEAFKASNLFKSMNQRVECLKALSYRQGKQEKVF